MENLNLALLSTPVTIKKVSSDVRAQPSNNSEKEFSGVLTQEEGRVDNAQDGSTVKPDERKKPPVERKAGKTPKAGSSAKHQPVKNEGSDKTAENSDDDDLKAGENIFVAVAVEEIIEDDLPEGKQLNEFVDSLEIQTLSTEMSEDLIPATTQTEIKELFVSGREVDMQGSVPVPKKLFTHDGDGKVNNEELLLSNLFADNGLDEESGEPQLQDELAEDEFAVKLFPVSITAEPVDKTAAEKVVEKVLVPDSKMKFAVVDSAKKKIELVENKKAENVKIDVAGQNTASDFSAATVTVAADQVVAKSEKGGQHKASVVERLSSQRGISLDELPAGVEVSVESETIASDEKLQRKANYSDRLADNKLLSGSQAGAVHLQGRARENQPSLIQNGQGQKDSAAFADGENSRSKAVFMAELKQPVSDKVISESAFQNGIKEKSLLETNFSKSGLLAEVNSDLSNTPVVKKDTHLILSKPLPISDEHLLNQIQAGLTRQANGRQTVTIKLWPEHLGRVDVKLIMHKQHLTATFMVDHPEVKDAMMRKIDSLRDSLGLRGIDAKDISIKVTPAKSGDGPSLMTENQQQNGNGAWRQFNQGNLANNNSGSRPGWDDNLNEEPLLAGTEIIENISSLAGDITDAGSLHITA